MNIRKLDQSFPGSAQSSLTWLIFALLAPVVCLSALLQVTNGASFARGLSLNLLGKLSLMLSICQLLWRRLTAAREYSSQLVNIHSLRLPVRSSTWLGGSSIVPVVCWVLCWHDYYSIFPRRRQQQRIDSNHSITETGHFRVNVIVRKTCASYLREQLRKHCSLSNPILIHPLPHHTPSRLSSKHHLS